MLCPKCGQENPDNAGQCSNCFYKFRFGNAFNDPKNMTFVTPGKSKESKIARYIFFSILLFLFILIIVSWIKSL